MLKVFFFVIILFITKSFAQTDKISSRNIIKIDISPKTSSTNDFKKMKDLFELSECHKKFLLINHDTPFEYFLEVIRRPGESVLQVVERGCDIVSLTLENNLHGVERVVQKGSDTISLFPKNNLRGA
jgi:hypothetical protein